jgi:flagellar hook-associated protein 2
MDAPESDDNRIMGNVGISFGNPTSGQGFDVSSTVSQIVANLQAVETPWQTQLTTLQTQDTALTGIGTDLSTLSSALSSLNDFDGIFSQMEGSSSDNSVVELTSATAGAVAGSYTVVVSQLAQTYSYSGTAVGASDTLAGSLEINGQKVTISDGTATDSSGDTIPANNTLSSLASYINSGDYGVTATIVTGTAGSQLALMSDTCGAAGAVTLDGSALEDATTGVTGVTFSRVQKGQDAQLSVDGVSTTSSTNTVTTAIPGVTMQLLSAASTESVQVEITTDTTDVESAVTTFVSAYNTVVSDLTTQEGDDASGNPEPLYGSPDVALLQEQLQESLTFVQSSGAITSLSQLGITANDDGTLSLDTSTLDSALDSNYQDVVNFFQADNSFGSAMTTTLNNLGDNDPDGVIYLALTQDSAQESQLTTNISNEQSSISAQQTQLTTELNEANYTLEEIPSQLDEVNEMYSAITGYNEETSG